MGGFAERFVDWLRSICAVGFIRQSSFTAECNVTREFGFDFINAGSIPWNSVGRVSVSWSWRICPTEIAQQVGEIFSEFYW